MNEIKLDNFPGEISKRFEERCKIFANLIEHEPLSCKCPDNIEGGGIQCDVCEVGQTLKVYNDRLKIRSNLSETRPIFPCKCPIIEDFYILFDGEDTRCDVCKVSMLLLGTIRMYI